MSPGPDPPSETTPPIVPYATLRAPGRARKVLAIAGLILVGVVLLIAGLCFVVARRWR